MYTKEISIIFKIFPHRPQGHLFVVGTGDIQGREKKLGKDSFDVEFFVEK